MIRGDLLTIAGKDAETAFIEGTLKRIKNDSVTKIPNSAFYNYSSLTKASFASVTEIGSSSFARCGLTSVSFPNAQIFRSACFYSCVWLKEITLPSATYIEHFAFENCVRLIALYLPSSTVCELENVTAFSQTPIVRYTTYSGQYGYIYVPQELYNDYITAPGWSSLRSYIVAYSFGG